MRDGYYQFWSLVIFLGSLSVGISILLAATLVRGPKAQRKSDRPMSQREPHHKKAVRAKKI